MTKTGIRPDPTEIDHQPTINELIASHLEWVSVDWSGWFVLYRDIRSGDLWELSFPCGEMHGGGTKAIDTGLQ